MNTLNFAVVSFFNRFNGYGYLIPSDGGPDVFFAYNEIRNARYLTRGRKGFLRYKTEHPQTWHRSRRGCDANRRYANLKRAHAQRG